MVPEELYRLYTSDKCHAMTVALNRLAGWEMVGIFHLSTEYRDGAGLIHSFVVGPDGIGLDVEGRQAPDRIAARYRWAIPYEFRPLTEADIAEWYGLDDAEIEDAEEVARKYILPDIGQP